MSQTLIIGLDTIASISTNRASINRHDNVPGSPSLQLPEELDQATAVDTNRQLSKGRTVAVIATLTGITTVSSFSTGLLTVGLPTMALDLNLASNLLLWYVTARFANPIAFLQINFSGNSRQLSFEGRVHHNRASIWRRSKSILEA